MIIWPTLILDLLGLGGQVDGRRSEYAARNAYTNSSFVLSLTLNLPDLGLTSEYVNTFKPKAYLKAWIRFVHVWLLNENHFWFNIIVFWQMYNYFIVSIQALFDWLMLIFIKNINIALYTRAIHRIIFWGVEKGARKPFPAEFSAECFRLK